MFVQLGSFSVSHQGKVLFSQLIQDQSFQVAGFRPFGVKLQGMIDFSQSLSESIFIIVFAGQNVVFLSHLFEFHTAGGHQLRWFNLTPSAK